MQSRYDDNSISALSFDFLGGEPLFVPPVEEPGLGAAAPAEPAQPVPAVSAGSSAAQGAAEPAEAGRQDEMQVAPQTQRQPEVQVERQPEVQVVSAARRHAWGAFYLVRTLVVAVVVFVVSAIVLTMALNPDLTFSQALELLFQRVEMVVQQVADLFR